ncbi:MULTISPECIES: hypothetical protein [unclassified Crossiella]|uniref:hypothetical protein n=1 Tax=unclassified Crossiella TaxID=2620835 RepID=UPI001FFE6772|nr:MULTISPECIES: hypothetical protein [unclassified Crossiella]MCK2240982.1 hypothetical protein [Crossiella sp. S99.2]MCK2253874.1 hypothetical protein [Crossiella sp. S99.1]
MASERYSVEQAMWTWITQLYNRDSFMAVMEHMAESQVVYVGFSALNRPATEVTTATAELLHLRGAERLQIRTGELREHSPDDPSGRHMLARVTATVALSRLSPDEEQQLGEGAALGIVLRPRRVRRHTLRIGVHGGTEPDAGLVVEALLTVEGAPVAVTREIVPLKVMTALASSQTGSPSTSTRPDPHPPGEGPMMKSARP